MIQEAIQYKQYRSDFNHPDSLSVHRSVHRHEVRYQKHLNAAVINLISALAVVGIMAIWCFLPGALIVTVAYRPSGYKFGLIGIGGLRFLELIRIRVVRLSVCAK